MGSSEDDSQKKMELRVWVDGEEYTVDNSLSFISDAAYGTLDEPYVLDIDATAIRSIAAAAAADDDADWWTLQGHQDRSQAYTAGCLHPQGSDGDHQAKEIKDRPNDYTRNGDCAICAAPNSFTGKIGIDSWFVRGIPLPGCLSD